MGKKKIVKQTQEEILRETERQEAIQRRALQAAEKVKSKKKVEAGKVYIQSTYNNTLISVTDLKGNVLVQGSAGALGFKGPKKATPFAASKVAEAVSEKLKKFNLKDLDILVKGIGSGRDAAIRAFGARGFNIQSIKDITPIPHNGCRPPKVRRV